MGIITLKETPRKINVGDGEYIYINGILKQCRYWKTVDTVTKIEVEKHDFFIIKGDIVIDPDIKLTGGIKKDMDGNTPDVEERIAEFNELMDQLEKDDPDYEP